MTATKQQIPGGDTNPAPHPHVGNRLEEADQIEISCSRAGFGHREGASPLSETNARSSGQRSCDTLNQPWESSGLRDPERIDRLLLVVAIAVLASSLQGFAVGLVGERQASIPIGSGV